MSRKHFASILKAYACVLLIHSAASRETLNADDSGFEVLLLRDPTSRNCDVSYAGDSGLHKALRSASVHVEIKPARCTHDPSCNTEHISIVGRTRSHVLDELDKQCNKRPSELDSGFSSQQLVLSQLDGPPLEIHPLPGLVTGPTSNRVNIVFFSDGYIEAEKLKFLDDATRLGRDITINQTYAPVAPLLNFWGAFTPSEEPGIGVGGEPKRTVYGLYRDGTELRGVYTSKPEVARAACKSMGRQCNYPLLLGNDPLYGGLGGEFTISTASVFNGPLVLRHELGHSIIWVGDEYDGSAYFGVNASPLTPKHNISWAHWLTDQPTPNTPPRAERNAVPLLAYPWTMLNTTKPWSTTFFTSGTFDSALLRFSLSGVPETRQLSVTLDGHTLNWKANKKIAFDRWFYDLAVPGLDKGPHELVFKLNRGGREDLAQLCSVEVIEYGTSNEFNFTEGFVGAFPTYSPEVYEDPDPEPDRLDNHSNPRLDERWPTVSYRPTNEGCLMRQVAKPDFCVVCTEGLWLRLLARVNLIEGVSVTSNVKGISSIVGTEFGSKEWTVKLALVPLAHLRSAVGAEYLAHKGTKESYVIRWYKNDHEIEAWKNLTEVRTGPECGRTFRVEVTFISTEIRKDEKGYTNDRRWITTGCGYSQFTEAYDVV